MILTCADTPKSANLTSPNEVNNTIYFNNKLIILT